MGAPAGVDFEKFSVGSLKHAFLPGNKVDDAQGLAIFQEAVINSVSIAHIQIRSEAPRTVTIKSAGPVLMQTFVMHGNPTIQWSDLQPSRLKTGQFNFYGVQRHHQVIQVEPGVTDLMNIQLMTKLLQVELDFKTNMPSFLNLVNNGKQAAYLTSPVYGSPKQQYFVRQLLDRLCKRDQQHINAGKLLDNLLSCSMHDLESPDKLELTFVEMEAIASALYVLSQFLSVPNIYKKELKRISMDSLRFDKAVIQACGCTPQQFIRSAQMKMAKRMLEDSMPVDVIIRVTGYKNRIQQFKKDFLAYFGVGLSQFIRCYEGRPW